MDWKEELIAPLPEYVAAFSGAFVIWYLGLSIQDVIKLIGLALVIFYFSYFSYGFFGLGVYSRVSVSSILWVWFYSWTYFFNDIIVGFLFPVILILAVCFVGFLLGFTRKS
ncbi:hypothetical protein ACJJH9_07840 [Microbulbifer sp. DLAB2-AF]|uniref:hypothetical protein n=1 Tax=Microbulbifer sp. DLAB2-AF TaxID=3243395 RepID=UPI00403945E1